MNLPLGYGMAAREVELPGNAQISKIEIKAKIRAGQVKSCVRKSVSERAYGKRDSARRDAAAMESITRDWRGSVLFHGIIHRDNKTGAVPCRVLRKGKVVTDLLRKQ